MTARLALITAAVSLASCAQLQELAGRLLFPGRNQGWRLVPARYALC